MKKVKIENLSLVLEKSFFSFLGVSLIDKVKDKYMAAIPFLSCRAWIGDSLLKQKNPKANFKNSYPFSFEVNIKTGSTFIGIYLDKKNINIFLSNLKWLHKKEEQAKVKKSKVYLTQRSDVFLVEGSKYWKDSCWKIMLYTFYLKCMSYKNPKDCDGMYWDALLSDGNEEKLLRKLKIKKEIFCPSVYGEDLSYGWHDKEGFVSICSGRNPPMAKLLGLNTPLKDEETKKETIA